MMTRPLTTVDINNALLSDPIISKSFLGTFASNRLPPVYKMYQGNHSWPLALVVNYDAQSNPGSHWVAIWAESLGNVEYFDSFGIPPLHAGIKHWIRTIDPQFSFSDTRLQSFSASTCGYYCIHYLLSKARGCSLADIICLFTPAVPSLNDEIIVNMIHNLK
jgi:hypothetical protein